MEEKLNKLLFNLCRDCFISPSSKFRWQENVENIRGFHNLTDAQKLPHNVVNYFDGVVLQRLGSGGGMRFQVSSTRVNKL